MDFSHKYDNPNPEEKTNQLSKLFFCWLFPLFKYGYKNQILIKDLYNTAENDLSEHLGNKLERNWEQELKRAKTKNERPSLGRALQSTFIKPFVFYGFLNAFQTIICRVGQPIILALLLKFFEDTNPLNIQKGWLLGTTLILVTLFAMVLFHFFNLGLCRLGMQSRVATSSLIYRKLLRLNKSSIAQTAGGKILNLLTNDVSKFDLVPQYWHSIWVMPILIIVIGGFVYNSIGIAGIVGMIALVIQTVPLQGYLAKLRGRYRFKTAVHTDRRVQLTGEITSGMRAIKMYCWEKPFEKTITLVRNLELGEIRISSYISGIVAVIARTVERLTVFITMVTYVLLGNQLTGDKVFSTVQYYVILQIHIAILFPLAIIYLAEAKVSAKRIEDFLMLEETSTSLEPNIESFDVTSGTIKTREIKASWTQNSIYTLSNINVHIQPGLLYAVVGPIGAGKSSLLHLFLRELSINHGKLEINGSISYAPQEPWLFASSVQKNILFGQPYVKNKYKTVVNICALERDLQLLPKGDETLVGERGTSLSGGQRARINLARAIYRDADIYLLDDPLSAVDAHVSKHLFNKCIMNYLKNKTRVLVTHQTQFLKHVDRIILIKNGQIEKIGMYAEFAEDELEQMDVKQLHEEIPTQNLKRGSIEHEDIPMHIKTENDYNEKEPAETQELMEKSKIPASLCIEYLRNGNGFLLLLITVVVMIITLLSAVITDICLARWVNFEESLYRESSNASLPKSLNDSVSGNLVDLEATTAALKTVNITAFIENGTESTKDLANIAFDYDTRMHYIYTFGAFLLTTIILTTCRAIIMYTISLNSSKKLHKRMFSNILKAAMQFFDTNPSGRILSRFTKELGIIDEILPRMIFETVQIFTVMAGILIVVFIVSPWMIVPTAVLVLLFMMIKKVYLASSQNIKRIEGLAKAPVLSHISASIEGLTTIRISQAQGMIRREFDTLQDQHTSSWFLYLATAEAFGLYLDIVVIAYTATLIYQFLLFNDGQTTGGNVGLAITQSMVLIGMVQYGMRQTADLSIHMTSVERLMQYTRIPEEKYFEIPTKKPHRDWPQFGKIIFKHLTLQYNVNEPPILKQLNIDIQPGSKVGIVGRTGAGKSSLIAALFRLAPTEGSITIDNIDVNEIGLHDLRNKISTIPQEPVLFTATIRYNLDPSEKYDDKILWKALEDVELKKHINSLDQEVNEGGSNFSVGQRQLLCLARAILQNNKILVMDEATANVDIQTDQLIQSTIRKNFKDCTVLTIAHRLNTIMDSDKVLVMDMGEAVEYGHAYELLQNKNGLFSKLLKESGIMENKLCKIAEDAYNDKVTTEINHV